MKYSLKANLTKLAPKESQYCKIFLASNKMHWKEIAAHLLNVLKEYPASKAFWYSEKRDSKEYKQKETYPINLKKIMSKIDHDLELLKTQGSESQNETEKYKKLDEFLKDLFTVFRNAELFIEPGKRKYRYSQACHKFVMYLLSTEGIFGNLVDNQTQKTQQNLKIHPKQNKTEYTVV